MDTLTRLEELQAKYNAMRPRIEELEDYSELEGLVDPAFMPLPAPLSRCFVHRGEDGKIDGYCFIQTVVVVEPIWVAEHKRGTTVGPHLFAHAVHALGETGEAKQYICHAVNEEIGGYLKRLGLKEIGKTFVGEVI